MSLYRYEQIKSLMESRNNIEELVRKHGNADAVPDIHREYTVKIRKAYKDIDRNYIDQLEKPITNAWRTVVTDPDDIALSGYHFRIMTTDPDEWTDEEIEEYIMDEVGYGSINSPYDCTGKRFTRWCAWSRQPVGIVMIHAWGTDL